MKQTQINTSILICQKKGPGLRQWLAPSTRRRWGRGGTKPRPSTFKQFSLQNSVCKLVSCPSQEFIQNDLSQTIESIHACSVTKSSLTLCNPMDWSLPGYPVYGISQARILEWLPFLPPRDLPDPEIETASPALAGGFFTTEPPGKSSWKHRNWEIKAVSQSYKIPYLYKFYLIVIITYSKISGKLQVILIFITLIFWTLQKWQECECQCIMRMKWPYDYFFLPIVTFCKGFNNE